MYKKNPQRVSSYRKIEEPQTDCREITRFSIADYGLDEAEIALLHVFRCIWLSCTKQSNAGWEAAFEHCALMFGTTDGPTLLGRAAALNRAIRSERNKPFDFMSPYCPSCKHRLSDAEAEMFSLIKSVSANNPKMTWKYAKELTLNTNPHSVLHAVMPLSALLMCYSTLAAPQVTEHIPNPSIPRSQLN